MAPIRRGDVYRADLEPVRGHEQGGQRPILVVSHDVFNQISGTVIALAITSQPQRAGYPLTLKLPSGILPRESWVKISQIRTLSTERLADLIGQVSEGELARIIDGLNELIG